MIDARTAGATIVPVTVVDVSNLAPFLGPEDLEAVANSAGDEPTQADLEQLSTLLPAISLNGASIERFVLPLDDGLLVLDAGGTAGAAVAQVAMVDLDNNTISGNHTAHAAQQPTGAMLAQGVGSNGQNPVLYEPPSAAALQSNCDDCNAASAALTIISAFRCVNILICTLTNGLSSYALGEVCNNLGNCPPNNKSAVQTQTGYGTTCLELGCDWYVATIDRGIGIYRIGVDASWAYPGTASANGPSGGGTGSHHSWVPSNYHYVRYVDQPYTARGVQVTSDWPASWTRCAATVKASFGVTWNDGTFFSTGYGTTVTKPFRTDCPGYRT